MPQPHRGQASCPGCPEPTPTFSLPGAKAVLRPNRYTCPHAQALLAAPFPQMQLLLHSRASDILHLPAPCARSNSLGPPAPGTLTPLPPPGSLSDPGSAAGVLGHRLAEGGRRAGEGRGALGKDLTSGLSERVRKGEHGVSLSPHLFKSASDL